jgi:WXG100 family type VII secretion target
VTDRVHFDFGRVQQLADTQQDFHGRFEAVLGEVRATVNQLLGQWLGEGTEEYRAKQTAFENNYTELQAAFANLQRQTTEAHSNFTAGANQIKAIWS